MYTITYTLLSTCIHIHIYKYIYINTYAYIYIHMCIHININMHVSEHICVGSARRQPPPHMVWYLKALRSWASAGPSLASNHGPYGMVPIAG